MITSHSNQGDFKPKKIRKLQDDALIVGITESKIFHLLFFKFKESLWQMLRQYMSANGVILSYGLIGLTRYKHGSCLGLTVFFLSTLLIYNSAKLWPLTPVAIFSIPFLPIFNSLDDLVNLLFINIRSQNLLIYGGVFALVSLTNTVMNWLGFQNKSHTTRGVSWLYLLFDKLLSRYIPVSEFFICCFVEPVLAIGAGIYLWRSGIDATFGSFLILMGTNEIVFQLIEHSHRVRVQTFLKG